MRRRALIAYWLSEAPLVLRVKRIATAVLPASTQVHARIVERPTSLRHFMVAAMRIDSLKLSRLDFVKMDVEGHASCGGMEPSASPVPPSALRTCSS
jgi:hypothetical protein